MIIPEQIAFSNAQSNFAIANTPSFLINSLRNDSTVQYLSASYSEDDLVDDLKEAVEAKATNLREVVMPFVILVALSLKPTSGGLRRAMEVVPAACDSWFQFNYVRDMLLQAHTATSRTTVKNLINVGIIDSRSSTSATTKLIVPN